MPAPAPSGVRQLLVVGPSFPWGDVQCTPTDWRDCEVIESTDAADAIRHLHARAFDVVVTNPATSMAEDLALLATARERQPGIRAIVLAPAFTPAEIISALRARVFACFSMPPASQEFRQAVGQALDEIGGRMGIEVVSALPHWIALRVGCRRIMADRLTGFIIELASDLAEQDRFALGTAFREALLNGMEHGAGFDPDKVVEITMVRTRRTIVCHFKDPGRGFDVTSPGHVATPDDPISHIIERDAQGQRQGGFGLLLTRRLVDEVHYSERGNELILVKYVN